MSYPLVSETTALTFDPFILEPSGRSKFKGLQCKPGALVEITTILLFVSVCAHQRTPRLTRSTSRADVSLLVCLSSVTVTTRSSVSQHSQLPGHQKERNASKSDKAQCSFCGFSETRPSLSPTHICTITSRCLKSPSQPAYRKTCALSLSVLFHFLSRHVWLRCFAFPQLRLRRSRAEALQPETHANARGGAEGLRKGGTKTLKCTHPCSPLCSDFSNKSTIMRNHYFCYVFTASRLHYMPTLSPPYSASPSPLFNSPNFSGWF